jgi:hypothetical protein
MHDVHLITICVSQFLKIKCFYVFSEWLEKLGRLASKLERIKWDKRRTFLISKIC